jgi:hypothetical protein
MFQKEKGKNRKLAMYLNTIRHYNFPELDSAVNLKIRRAPLKPQYSVCTRYNAKIKGDYRHIQILNGYD